MQSISRFLWNDFGQAKLSDMVALEKMRPAPVVDIPMLNKLKRKCSEGPDAPTPSQPAVVKKQRSELEMAQQCHTNQHLADMPVTQSCSALSHPSNMGHAQNLAAPRANTLHGVNTDDSTRHQTQTDESSARCIKSILKSTTMDATSKPVVQEFTSALSPLQQIIENEFNVQILMKHNELRLIEQELAKCQIALEQLRRCELQPFPGHDHLSHSVSEGRGPAVAPPRGFTHPPHAAPYGVTDGPYSRHYRQWLLQDAQFDPVSIQSLESPSDSRSTRFNGAARKSVVKSTQPSSRRSETLQSLPQFANPTPKDKSAPLVLRRSTDGKLVKLMCNKHDPPRGNFSSIQGFLNHCRIAHKVDYKSHDQAAIDSGVILDENELANLPPETHALSVPKQSASRSHSVAHPPPPKPNVNTNIHPLNTSVGAAPPPIRQPPPPAPMVPARSLSSATSISSKSPFKSSSQVPRLSALFAKHNYGIDLEKAAAAAKQKIDIWSDDLISPDIPSQQSSPLTPAPAARPFTGASRPGGHFKAPERPASQKGYRQPVVQQRPRPAPLIPAAPTCHVEMDMPQSPNEFSPAATSSPHAADSNPGMVSDHDDDDHASDEDSPHDDGHLTHHHHAPPLPVPRQHCADNNGSMVDVEDVDALGQHGVIIRRNSITAAEARSGAVPEGTARKVGK